MSKELIPEDEIDVRSFVRQRYGAIAQKSSEVPGADCCPSKSPSQSTCCEPEDVDSGQFNMVSKLYEDPNVSNLPKEVTDLSLGCGDPITLADLKPGETVLDLGAGGGIDCFLAAKKVGPTGKVIGVDMTPAMVERARANKKKMGIENVEFRLGEIEHLPVADRTVDVIISNCVINLSIDKQQVFREAFRVLKPGGKLAVSDIVTDGPLPKAIKTSLSAWAGCIAGALDVQDYIQAIKEAGFVNVQVIPSYWDEEMITAAVEQLEPELAMQVEDAKGQGKPVLIINDSAKSEVIVVDQEDGIKDFDPQKAIFSAKVTASKPL